VLCGAVYYGVVQCSVV